MTVEATLLVNLAALVLMPLALIAFLIVQGKREQIPDRVAEVTRRLLDERLRAANLVTNDDVAPLATGVDKLRLDVASLTVTVEQLLSRMPTTTPAPLAPEDRVALERQILSESWKQFRRNGELSAALDDALQEGEWTQLLDQLVNIVPADLKPTFDSVVAPCREQRALLKRIGLIPRIAAGNLPRLPTDAEEIRRTRELAALLTSEVPRIVEFRFRNWVTDSFIGFADLYLQRYQQAQLDDGAETMRQGVGLVRQVLRAAAVEPIEVTPGETLFDSTRHVGRSTSNDPRFSDGVITGVVRNGFIEGGQLVIRQPEVIVNRMR